MLAFRALALFCATLFVDCECGSTYPKDLAGAEIQPDAAAVRVSNVVFKFVQRHLESILRNAFEIDPTGEYAIIYIPEGDSSPFCDELNRWPGVVPSCNYTVRARDGCIGPGEPNLSGTCSPNIGYPRATYRSYLKVRIADLVDHLSIEIEPPTMFDNGGIRVRIKDLMVDGSLGLYINATKLANNSIGLGAITCQFTKQAGAQYMLKIDEIDVSVQPIVQRSANGPPTLTSTALVRAVRVSGLSLDAKPLPQDQTCVTQSGVLNCADTCMLAGEILKLGSDAFNAINDVIAPALPYIATPVANALMLVLANKPLELGGPLPLKDLAFIPKGAGRDLWVMTSAGEGAFQVTQQNPGREDDPTLGFTIPMWAGAYAENSPCAEPVAPMPPYSSQLPVFDGTVKLDHPLAPGTTYDEQYHFAMMVSQSYLNQIAYGVRNSGVMCAQIGSQGEGLLNSGSFVPTAGLLFLLAPPLERMAAKDAPILLKLKPGMAPRIEIGNGAIVGRDENGRPIRNSLINLYVNQMGVEFHLFMYDRFVRTFVLEVDLSVGLTITPGKDGKLALSVDQIKAERITEQFNELFPGYDFSKVTEVIFTVFASQLSPDSLKFDLPLNSTLQQALGSNDTDVKVLSVRRDGPNDDLLAAYIKLCDQEAKDDPTDIACSGGGAVTRDAEPFATATLLSTTPALNGEGAVVLQVDGAADHDWQWSVDAGPYSRFSGPNDAQQMRIDSKLFHVMGKHTVALRHRAPGQLMDFDQPTQQFELWLDPKAPTLQWDTVRGVVAQDDVTPLDRLSYQIDQGDWLSADAFNALTPAPGQHIVARDLGNNLSLSLIVPGGSAAPAKQGCASTSSGAWLALALLALLPRFRRRRG